MWNVVGEAHFRARHWDEAIKALTKAGELRLDENVTGWYHLAMAFWQKGDEQNAPMVRQSRHLDEEQSFQ